MKKIISLVLLFACMLSLFACSDGVDAFVEVVNSSAPNKIVTTTYQIVDKEKLEGEFVTLIEDDMITFNYWYDRYAVPGVDESEDRIFRPDPATVYYKDGKYSEDGENWFTEAPAMGLGNVGLNLNPENFSTYTVSKDKRTLVATLTNDEAAKVLGIEGLNADENGIELIVKTNGTKLVSVSVAYSIDETRSVSIKTSYEYIAPAPEADADGGDAQE